MSLDLNRFVLAQEARERHVGAPYSSALEELRKGHKTSHWIWYVFPQLLDRGRSSANNSTFQIRSKQEASEFLLHPVLGERYLTCVELVTGHLQAGTALRFVLGSAVDAKKFYHSVSTFALAAVSRPADHRVVVPVLTHVLLMVLRDAGRSAKAAIEIDAFPGAVTYAATVAVETTPAEEIIVACASRMISDSWRDLPS